MNAEVIKNIEGYIKNMPSLPTSVLKVIEVCNNPQTNPADLNHVISLDPVLVGRVLKLINSAYYGLSQKMTNLVRAIIMLGINTVKNLAFSAAIIGHITPDAEKLGLDMEGFWRHSLSVGVMAKQIARIRGKDPKILEEYFTAGLLHDLGKIPLNAIQPKEYVDAVSDAGRAQRPLFQEEAQKLGMNHCIAGAMIVKAWQLAGPVGDVIIYHHGYSAYKEDHQDILHTVMAANYISCLEGIGFSGDRYPEKVEAWVWELLGVNRDSLETAKNIVHEEIEKAKVFLKV